MYRTELDGGPDAKKGDVCCGLAFIERHGKRSSSGPVCGDSLKFFEVASHIGHDR